MVEISFQQASFFKKIIDSLSGLIEDVAFQCEKRGVELQAMDVSHVSLISIKLPADLFESYRCDSPMSLTFNVDTLQKALKSAASTDTLVIRTDHEGDEIEMRLSTPSDDRRTQFRLKPVDVEQNPVDIPEHTYKAKLKLSSSAFSQLVKSLSEFDNGAVVRCTDGSITFSVNDSLLQAETTFSAGIVNENMDEEVEVEVTEPCRVSYALNYLKAFASAGALSNRVKLSFSSLFPLLVEYELNQGGYIRFFLAPKVEEHEDEEA